MVMIFEFGTWAYRRMIGRPWAFGGRARTDIHKDKHDLLRKNWADIERNFARFGFSRVELFENGLVSGVFTKHLKL